MRLLRKCWTRFGGMRGALLALYLTFVLFTYSFIVQTQHSFSALIRSFSPIFFFSLVAAPFVIHRLERISIPEPAQEKPKEKRRFLIVVFIVTLIFFLASYAAYYPGFFTADSVEQFEQVVDPSVPLNDWHPVFQTLFAIKLPLTLTGGWIGSIILFQIILVSLAIGYAAATLYEYAGRTFALVSVVYILLNTWTAVLFTFAWKDVTFAIGALFALSFAVNIYFTDGEWIKAPAHAILYALAIAFTTLARHNAILFTAPLMIASLFHMRGKIRLILPVCAIALILIVRIPIYSALNVEAPGYRQVEKLGLPMNIIGSAVTYTPEKLDDEVLDFAYKIAPRDEWENSFKYGDFNHVKFNHWDNLQNIEDYGTARVLKMALRCLVKSPVASLKGLISLTDPVYTLFDDYGITSIASIKNNPYGLNTKGIAPLRKILNLLVKVGPCALLPHLFQYVGVMMLALVACVLAKCRLNRWADWKRILLVLPVFAYNFGTMLLLSARFDARRFFHYTFLLMPLFIAILFVKTKKGAQATQARDDL